MFLRYLILNIFLLIFSHELVFSQRADIWAFGYNLGLDFNNAPPTLFYPTIRRQYHSYSFMPKNRSTSSSSITNCNGQLLFYSSDCQVWNRLSQPMSNGTLANDCNYGLPEEGGGFNNTNLIIPKPGDSSRFYVVYSVPLLIGTSNPNAYEGIFYSEIDMNLNSGLGDIDSIKNIRISKLPSSGLIFIPNSNDTDFWLITKPNSDSFFVYKITRNGIDSVPIKSYGLGNAMEGILKPSHDYKQIVSTGDSIKKSIYSAFIFDFNRNTGYITNPKPILKHTQHSGKVTLAIEFSPNDSLIYLSTAWQWPINNNNKLIQVERYASDIPSTMVSIKNNVWIAGMQIGPDNKIYVANNSTYPEKIGVIHYPNKKGIACNFIPNQYNLTTNNLNGCNMPNLSFPIFNLSFSASVPPNNCFEDSIRFTNLSDSNFVSFIWKFGDGDSAIVSDRRDIAHKYLNEGQYCISLLGNLNNHNYCYDKKRYSDTVIVKFKPISHISYDSIIIKCPNQTIFLKDTTFGRVRSEWYWGDSSNIDTGYYASHLFDTSGIYNIKLTSFNQNCSDTDSIQVHITINQMPVADFILSDSVECFNNNLFQLTNTSSGKGNLKYLWQFGDGDTSTLYDTLHSYLSADTFNVMLICSSDSVCRDTAIKKVIVNASPNSSFSVSDTIQCFIDNYFTLFNQSSIKQGTITFLWDFGNSVTSKVFETSIHYDTAGNYNVSLIATSGFGCTDTNIIQMQVKSEPVAAFTTDDSIQCLSGNKFSFKNNSTILVDTFLSYWNFGDDTISTIASPVYNYLDTGNFIVKLITTSSFGCKDTISKKIAIYPDPSVLSVSGEDHCGPGKVYLSAVAENGTINWYSFDVGGTLLYQGDTFFTNSGATYYTEAVNPGCASSPRSPITSTVKYIPKIISTTPASNLLPAKITLRAFPDNGIVNWYDTSVGGELLANGTSFTTPFLDSSKMYYVDAIYLGCTTLSRTGIKATIGPNSINDHFNEVQVIFYPNPVNDVLIIEINNLTEKAILTFIDIQGRIVKIVNLNPVNSKITGQIDLYDLPQGLYMLNLRNDSVYKTARLVKF